MKTNKCILLVFLFMVFNIAVGYCQTKKVAILNIVDKDDAIDYSVKLLLTGTLSEAISNTPGYEAYERVDMASIMSEHEFMRTGLVNDEQIKQLGVMTGADYILITEVAKFDENNFVIASKIIDVETTKIDKLEEIQTTANIEMIEKSCRMLAARLLSKEVAEDNLAEYEEVIEVVEKQASFPGGQTALSRFLAKNLRYPEEAQENNIEGRVIVQFVVEKNGEIGHVKIVRGVHPELDKEALRVVELFPPWTPGMNNFVPVRSKFTLPVTFRLQH